MGKKRERPFESAPKRRTKLQIGSASSTRKDGIGTGAFGSTFQEASRTQNDHNPLSGLLGHYGDSDEEDSQENQQGQAVAAGKPKNEIDAKVADFLAEIDALDGVDSPGETSEAQSKQSPEESAQGYPQQDATLNQAVESTSDLTSATAGVADAEHMVADSTNGEAGELGEWQELLDEATNCVYYWNTVTSEVTWEMPEVLKLATQQMAGQSYDQQASNGAAAQDFEPTDPMVTPGDAAVVGQQQGDKPNEESLDTQPKTDFQDEKVDLRKMPVYGPGKVEYELSPEPEIEEEEFELQKPEAKKPTYSMFVKGDVLPGSDTVPDVSASEEMKTTAPPTNIPAEDAAVSTNGDEEIRMDGLEDDMDIDEQLERALERRKAELQQLEREGSPSPHQLEKKRKASEVVEIYDDKGEVNLLAIKRKRMENLRNGKKSSAEMIDQGTQCDEELKDIAAKKKAKEEADMKKEISEMSSLLDSKLGFLGIARKDLTKFHIMLIEKEVRVRDWREGSLESKHLLRHLKSADWEFQRYELEAAPSGWSCNWDREHKQYYYTNAQLGVSQWDYPVGAAPQEGGAGAETEVTSAETESRSLFNQASLTEGMEHGKYVQADGSAVPLPQEAASSSVYNTLLATTSSIAETPSMDFVSYPTPYVAPVLTAPAPPPPSLPAPIPPPSLNPSQSNPPLPSSKSKPPPPPPGTELFPPLPDSPPPPLPSGSGPELPPLPSSPPPPPPPPDDDGEGACDSTRAMTPPPLPVPQLPTEMMPGEVLSTVSSSSTIIGKPQVLYSAPTPSISGGAFISADANYTAPVLYSTPAVTASAPSLPAAPTTGAQPTAKLKKKKEKSKSKTASKKNKLPLSLVQKWQQIKEEVEREEIADEESEDEDDDPTLVTQKRIEQWKKEQLAGGLSTKNANFEMIQGDWRERLKKKPSQNS